MIALRWRRAWLALTLSLILASIAVAQEPLLPQAGKARFSTGTHILRRCLFERKFQPLRNTGELDSDSLLIVLGDPAPLATLASRRPLLRDFVQQGGAILFATDWEVSPRTERDLPDVLNDLAGVNIYGQVLVNIHSPRCYKNRDYQPFLFPAKGDTPSRLFAGLEVENSNYVRVATDLPTCLTLRKDGLPAGISYLAFLPDGCRIENGPPVPPDGTRPLFAVGGEIGKGKILVMADHSVFINSVMAPMDTTNVEFTQNVLKWLSEKDGGRRNKALLFTDGTVENLFEVPVKQNKLSPRDARAYGVAYIDAALHQWETRGENGVFNDAINKLLPRLWPFLTALLGMILFGYLVYRFTWAGSFRREPGLALFSRAVALHRPEGPVLGERHEAQIRDNNFLEEAQAQARTFFADALGLESCPKTMPKVVVRTWWGRGSLNRMVERLWTVARGKNPKPVTKKQWTALLSDLETLRGALKDQALRLQPGGKASS